MFRLPLFALLFLIVIHHPSTRAAPENCGPVDLRGPRLGPPRNQGDIGWCYAYGAADLLSYHLGQQVSASDLALRFNHNLLSKTVRLTGVRQALFGNSETDFEGGNTSMVLDDAMANGVCLEKNFRSDPLTPAGSYQPLTVKAMMLNLERHVRETARKMAEDVNRGLREPCTFHNEIPTQLGSLRKLMDRIEVEGSGVEAVRKFRDIACGERTKFPPGFIMKSESLPWWGKKTERMDALLSAKKPFTISYNHRIFLGEKAKGSADHVSSVIGRRINPSTGVCEYLIRNTWGNTCRTVACENGQAWIPRDRVKHATSDIQYIEEPK